MRRIVCIGNRLVAADDAGPRVFDALSRRALPDDVEVVDGALAGLDLLPLLERSTRVVFVDAAEGLPADAPVALLLADDIAAQASVEFGHAAGLPWLLRIAPSVADGPLASVAVIGVSPDADAAAVERAADVALSEVN